MAKPEVTLTGTLSPTVDGGYILAELSQSVILTDVTTPTIKYKTLAVPYKALISTDGQLYPEGGIPGDPFKLPPCRGTLVAPSFGAFYKARIVTTKGNLTTKSKEFWEIDSSLTSLLVSSIALIAELPVGFYLHNQLAGLNADDHPQYAQNVDPEDIEITNPARGFILRSGDGARRRLTMDNSGIINVDVVV